MRYWIEVNTGVYYNLDHIATIRVEADGVQITWGDGSHELLSEGFGSLLDAARTYAAQVGSLNLPEGVRP